MEIIKTKEELKKQRCSEASKRYYQKHKEKVRLAQSIYNEKTRQIRNDYVKTSYAENTEARERKKAKMREYMRKRAEKTKAAKLLEKLEVVEEEKVEEEKV